MGRSSMLVELCEGSWKAIAELNHKRVDLKTQLQKHGPKTRTDMRLLFGKRKFF